MSPPPNYKKQINSESKINGNQRTVSVSVKNELLNNEILRHKTKYVSVSIRSRVESCAVTSAFGKRTGSHLHL